MHKSKELPRGFAPPVYQTRSIFNASTLQQMQILLYKADKEKNQTTKQLNFCHLAGTNLQEVLVWTAVHPRTLSIKDWRSLNEWDMLVSSLLSHFCWRALKAICHVVTLAMCFDMQIFQCQLITSKAVRNPVKHWLKLVDLSPSLNHLS